MRVAVVGAGIVGLSAAYFLARRGHRVTLFERFPLFHRRGSSHGRSRIVRRAYPDSFFTGIMAEAYPLWRELESASGETLLHECGLAYFGPTHSPRIQGVESALREHDVPMELVSASQSVDRLGIRLSADEIAIFTLEAGWVAADVALRVLAGLARDYGAQFQIGQSVDPFELAREFDGVALAAGPWMPSYVPIPVRVSLQTFVDAPQPAGGPVWIDDENLTYGFPADALGAKVGAHQPGETFDPDSDLRPIKLAHLEQIADTLAKHFTPVSLSEADGQTCIYTNTESEDFCIGRVGENVCYVSACSGHGFKMGPWSGRLLANLVDGTQSPADYPRFTS